MPACCLRLPTYINWILAELRRSRLGKTIHEERAYHGLAHHSNRNHRVIRMGVDVSLYIIRIGLVQEFPVTKVEPGALDSALWQAKRGRNPEGPRRTKKTTQLVRSDKKNGRAIPQADRPTQKWQRDVGENGLINRVKSITDNIKGQKSNLAMVHGHTSQIEDKTEGSSSRFLQKPDC